VAGAFAAFDEASSFAALLEQPIMAKENTDVHATIVNKDFLNT
jgi:hypothetical protein